jgi:hypothetical protein
MINHTFVSACYVLHHGNFFKIERIFHVQSHLFVAKVTEDEEEYNYEDEISNSDKRAS